MSNNWYKYKNFDPKTRGIVINMDKSRAGQSKGNTKLKHQVSIFFKLGNSATNPYNAVETIKIYEKFSHEYGSVWISTDSLYRGMSEKRIDEFNYAIQNNKIVDLYLIPGVTSAGNNEITHKAEVLEIKGNKNGMISPDISLTPKEWVKDYKKIWIKVDKIKKCSTKKVTDFMVISSKKILSDAISKSQYNFGYIEEI